jgi:hypothetical protein
MYQDLKVIKEEVMTVGKVVFIGEVTQIVGVGAFVAGIILSLHHWPAAVALVAGMAAYFVGKKLRGA